LDENNEWSWYQNATLHSQINDLQGYRRACREMLKRFGNTGKPDTAERIATACSLAPDAVNNFEAVLKLADRAVKSVDQSGPDRQILLAKGLAEYRAGHFVEAIGWFTRNSPKAEGASADAFAFAGLALAHHKLGHSAQAVAALACARTILADRQPNPAKGRYFGDDWQDWLHGQILHREAEAVIGSNGKSTKDNGAPDRDKK
jgi:hypothetical protein